MRCSAAACILIAALLAVFLLSTAEGLSVRRQEICSHRRMLAFRILGGRPRVAVLKFLRVDGHCEKVQTFPRSSNNFYISHDCRRCVRTGGDRWTCAEITDVARGAEEKKENCRSVLGPDCKPHLVDKNNQRKPCF